MKDSKKKLIIALVIVLIGSIFAMMFQTGFGSIMIKDIYLVTENQQYLHALMFVPKEASETNKVPCVVTSHGWLNSAEVQDAASIELARRGCVVIAMDAYGHGMSSSLYEGINQDSAVNGQGMVHLVEYATSGAINFIDTSRIGVMGHSMGSRAACNTVVVYGKRYAAAIEAAMDPDSEEGETITEAEQAYADSVNKVSAALPTGGAPDNISAENWPYVHCNIGFLYGFIEEGGYGKSPGCADLHGASKEALMLVHSVDESVNNVEVGKYYGNIADGTLRVLYQPYITHPLIHFSPKCTKIEIEFFTDTLGLKTNLSSSNQFFFIKECFNLVAGIGLFMMLIPMTDLLLNVPCFADLRGEEGPKVPALDTEEKKKKFWFGWALGGVMSFLFAWITVKLWTIPAFMAGNGYSMPNITFFAAPTMSYVAAWTFFAACWGFFWFWYNFKKDKAAGVRTDEMIGWKITGKEFWKTLGFAAVIMGYFYAVVWFCKWAFNTDARFWTPAVKTFDVQHLFYFFNYLPIFFAFYLSNSLMVNGASRFEGAKEGKELFILGLGNILGCGLMWLLQYGKLVLTGTVIWGPTWIVVLVICFCFWQLFLAPFLLRKFYKLTGKNWLGPLVVSSIYVMMGVMNTAIHSTIL